MTVAELLRSAGAWLQLAADEIDKGDIDKARNFARMGQFGVESQTFTAWIAERKKAQ